MPGSKRRALKKLLSPDSTPSQNPIQPPPGNSTSPTPLSPPASPTSSTKKQSSTSSLSSFLHPLSHSKSKDKSQTSIASDPNNYMSDEALKEDLAVEHALDQGSSAPTSLPPPPPPAAGGQTDGVFAQSPSPQPPTQQVTADMLMGVNGGVNGGGKKGKKGSKQRFEERQARKREALLNSAPPSDPNWTAQLEKERQEEIQVISSACTVMGRELFEIAPDGHCMYNAIADQLNQIGLLPSEKATAPYVRHVAANHILTHKDDFLPFLPSVNGEDSAGATDHDGVMTETEFKKYCHNVAETGEWGGEPEIQALSGAFSVPIHVFQRGPPTVVSHGGADDNFGGGLTPEQSLAQGDRVVRITYHRRMYGLGEHYNSLRKVGSA